MSIEATRFVSDRQKSPFGPQWDFVIATKPTEVDVEALSELILSKEEEIKEKYPDDWENYDDGDTGLGADSLTARFNHFNVLKWDHQACKDLHDEIRLFHKAYVNGTVGEKTVEKLEFKVRCWANVMRNGQQIKRHSHSSYPHAYLSGHFCVQCDKTATTYYHPYHEAGFGVPNEPGQMTMFPTWEAHSTTIHESDIPRISIAFDIVIADSTPENEEKANRDNLVPL